MAQWIATRRTAQDSIVHLYPDGTLAWATGRIIWGPRRGSSTQHIALAAGWLLMGDVELYDDAEVAALAAAARWSVERCLGVAGMRQRFHRPRGMRPVWTTLEMDRDGYPTCRCWRLPRLRWPGTVVFHEHGVYSLWSEIGRSGTCAPTGIRFSTLRQLCAHLEAA